jgi:hypothetical protein
MLEPTEVIVAGALTDTLLIDANGNLLASATPAGMGSGPCVADFDGDGHAEVAVANTSSIEMFELDLTPVWSRATRDTSGTASCSAFDFDADGAYEVVYADEETIWVLDGRDGSVLGSWGEHRSGTWSEYPVIADIDNDGSAEIVASQNLTSSGILVVGSPTDGWAPAGSSWAQWHFDGALIDNQGRVDPTPPPPWRDGGMAHARPPWGAYDSTDGSWEYLAGVPELAVDIVDVCAADCTDGPVTVAVTVRNEGLIDTDALVVLYSSDTTAGLVEVGRQTVTVPSGVQLASLLFEVPITALGNDGWSVTIGRADGGLECTDLGKTDSWAEGVCGG